jgi:hypothetical protein
MREITRNISFLTLIFGPVLQWTERHTNKRGGHRCIMQLIDRSTRSLPVTVADQLAAATRAIPIQTQDSKTNDARMLRSRRRKHESFVPSLFAYCVAWRSTRISGVLSACATRRRAIESDDDE